MKSYKLSRWLFLSVRMSFLDLQPKHVNYTSQFIILSADLWVLTCEWTCEWTAGLLTGCQQLPWGLMSWQELHPTLRTNVMLTISPLPTPIAHQLCVCVSTCSNTSCHQKYVKNRCVICMIVFAFSMWVCTLLRLIRIHEYVWKECAVNAFLMVWMKNTAATWHGNYAISLMIGLHASLWPLPLSLPLTPTL